MKTCCKDTKNLLICKELYLIRPSNLMSEVGKNKLEKDFFNAERQAEALHFAYHSVGVFPYGYRVIPKCEVGILFANSLEFWNYWIQFECHMKTYDRKLRN